MNQEQLYTLAIDVGGTSIKSAVVSSRGEVFQEISRPTHTKDHQSLDSVLAIVTEQYSGSLPIAAIGVVCAGVVDIHTGIVSHAVNLRWHNLPLIQVIHDHLLEIGAQPVPIAVDNDVIAGGIAESRLGAGIGVDQFLFLPLGTGIAGAIMINGQPFRGATGSGEIGHMIVQPGGIACTCGAYGCWERYCSAAALVRIYNASPLAVVPATGAVDIVQRMLDAEPLATQVWDDAMNYLLQGIANYCTILGPHRIILGGGLSKAGSLLSDTITAKLDDYPLLFTKPEIVLAQLVDKSGELGASLIAFDALGINPDAQIRRYRKTSSTANLASSANTTGNR